jgi:gas vesicle protein
MKAFLFGLGLGIGLGVLFAPMSGEETRENLAQRAGDLADSARDSFEQGRDRVQRGIGAIRNISGGEGTQRPTGTETTNP